MKTTPARTRAPITGLLARITAVLALAVALAIAVLAIPTASAETPAERCARETNTYNTAWKQSWVATHPGKTISDAPAPPVPYTCQNPNTTTPTTPSTAPPATLPGTTTATPGPGPNMGVHAPTDIPAPGKTPIVRAPRNTTSESPNTERVKPRQRTSASTTAAPDRQTPEPVPTALVRKPLSNVDHSLWHDANDGHTKVEPFGDRCEDGYHRNNYGLGFGPCYPDYDYNVTSTEYVDHVIGETPIYICGYKLKCDKTEKTASTTTTTEEVGGQLGGTAGSAAAASVNASVTAKYGISTTKTVEYGNAYSFDTGELKPGETLMAYPAYNIYRVTADKYNTQTKQVEGTETYIVKVPIEGMTTKVERL
ncbi:hypothetical protein [Gordonia sp. CPCC 205333]|uniref:hypothetical protein n=1 Tax=Gordonia sp. CPCC 205333 TaxID=3140790 RepID=UPI003AF3A2C4